MTEISEAFFAGAIVDSVETIEAALKNDGGKSLLSYYKVIMQRIGTAKNSPVTFADSAKRKEYSNAMVLKNTKLADVLQDKDDIKVLNNLIQGMTAAIDFRNKLDSTKDKLGYKNVKFLSAPASTFMTGSVWPDDIGIFKNEIDDWKDYNSTDVMVTWDKRLWLGVSLKKKPNPNSIDPTLINKSFEEILNGKGFKNDIEKLLKAQSGKNKGVEISLSDQISNAKKEFYIGVVIDAVNNGYIKYQDIKTAPRTIRVNGKNVTITNIQDKKDFNAWIKTQAGRNELYESKYIDKVKFFKSGITTSEAKYINVKGSPGNYWNLSKADMKKPGGMRFYVNSRLSDVKEGLFSSYVNILNQYANVFGELLLSLVLKTKLEDVIVNKIKKDPRKTISNQYTFGFYLVTGQGTINKAGKITNTNAETKSLKTVLCGIGRVKKNIGSNYKVEVYKKELKTAEGSDVEYSEAAKVYLHLKSVGAKKQMNILDLELRFKGNFMVSPQFQATMTEEFKKFLKGECEGN